MLLKPEKSEEALTARFEKSILLKPEKFILLKPEKPILPKPEKPILPKPESQYEAGEAWSKAVSQGRTILYCIIKAKAFEALADPGQLHPPVLRRNFNIQQATPAVLSVQSCPVVLFCFVLFCFVLFCFVLFCSVQPCCTILLFHICLFPVQLPWIDVQAYPVSLQLRERSGYPFFTDRIAEVIRADFFIRHYLRQR